jgi:hypothetical protein
MHDGGPDGTVIPYTFTQLRDARRQAAATPHMRRAWLRGRCMGLWGRLLACSLYLPLTWGQHEAAAEEIETRSPKHLALQHLQTVDVSLDRAATPGQRHPGFDRRIILVESGSKALQGLQRTGGRAREPRIELRRLPLADQSGKVLRQVDGLGDLGRLRVGFPGA